MTRGPGERVAAMLSLFRGIADEILVALDDRAGPEVEAPLAAVADRVIRYPYAEPVDRPLAWLHAECRGDWVLTIDDDEVPMQALLDALPVLAQAEDVTHYWLPRRWLFGELDRWLDARPWRPDYQPRLVLNDPARALVPDRDARPGQGARAVPLPRHRLLPPRHAAQLARGPGGEGAALRALAPWEARRGAAAERGLLRAGARRSADRGSAAGGLRIDRGGFGRLPRWPSASGGGRGHARDNRRALERRWVRERALVPRGRPAAASRPVRKGRCARREPLRGDVEVGRSDPARFALASRGRDGRRRVDGVAGRHRARRIGPSAARTRRAVRGAVDPRGRPRPRARPVVRPADPGGGRRVAVAAGHRRRSRDARRARRCARRPSTPRRSRSSSPAGPSSAASSPAGSSSSRRTKAVAGSGGASELRGEARPDHGRARVHRLEPRPAPRRGGGGGHPRRLADPGVRREPREHRRDRGRRAGEHLGRPRRALAARARPRPGCALQPRRPDEPRRLAARPVHRPRHQLPRAALDPRGLPASEPRREGRLRLDASALRPAASTCRWTRSIRSRRSTRTG